jgi:hypothetical protein
MTTTVEKEKHKPPVHPQSAPLQSTKLLCDPVSIEKEKGQAPPHKNATAM